MPCPHAVGQQRPGAPAEARERLVRVMFKHAVQGTGFRVRGREIGVAGLRFNSKVPTKPNRP